LILTHYLAADLILDMLQYLKGIRLYSISIIIILISFILQVELCAVLSSKVSGPSFDAKIVVVFLPRRSQLN